MATKLKENEASICFNGMADLFTVYRPDGLYAKEVRYARTRYGAERIVAENGWTLVGSKIEHPEVWGQG